MLRIKTISLLSLFAILVFLSAFKPQTTASIVGSWTRTEELNIVKQRGSSAPDTIVSHDKGFAITYTIDSQYHYSGPHGRFADGIYSVSDSMLHEVSAAQHSARWVRIVTLTEHKLVFQTKGRGIESPITTETITTYTR